AFGRGHAGHVDPGAWERQARNGASARTRSQTGDTILAVSGDNAGDSVARACERCQARDARLASAGCCNADGALRRDPAANADVTPAAGRQPQTLAMPNPACQAVALAASGRGPAGGAITGAGSKRQARNAATTSAGCKALHTDNAFSGDRAGHAIACKQARNAAAPSARSKTADAISAAGADQAGHRVALAASGKPCQARNTATAHTRRNSSDAAACKANCAGCCCCEPRAGCGAQGCSTATQGLPARKGRGGRERSARL